MKIDQSIPTASGTNTYTVSFNPTITAYVTNQIYYVKFTNANTGPSTLNVDDVGAKTLTNFRCTSGQIVALTYDGTNLQMVSGHDTVETIALSLDGQGNVPTTGSKGYRLVANSGNITHWYVIGGATGSIQFDIARGGTSIIGAGNKPLLSSTQRNDASPSSWTSVAIAANDELEFIVDSASTLTSAWLYVQITT